MALSVGSPGTRVNGRWLSPTRIIIPEQGSKEEPFGGTGKRENECSVLC